MEDDHRENKPQIPHWVQSSLITFIACMMPSNTSWNNTSGLNGLIWCADLLHWFSIQTKWITLGLYPGIKKLILKASQWVQSPWNIFSVSCHTCCGRELCVCAFVCLWGCASLSVSRRCFYLGQASGDMPEPMWCTQLGNSAGLHTHSLVPPGNICDATSTTGQCHLNSREGGREGGREELWSLLNLTQLIPQNYIYGSIQLL